MTPHEKAKDLFLQGCNCSQAVLCAFCDQLGMDFDTAMRIASSFGGGVGRQREICGTVSGMCMVAGLKCGYSTPGDQAAKAAHYALIQKLCARFREENGSIICRELLGMGGCKKEAAATCSTPDARTPAYYKKRPCPDLAECAAKILEEMIPSLRGTSATK